MAVGKSAKVIEGAVKPPALRKGDRVALVCPASRPASAAAVKHGQRVLAEMGFTTVVGKNVLRWHGASAGTAEERLEDFNTFLMDDSVRGIFCLTGGFGSMHLLAHLDYFDIGRRPKVIVGCDDNTSLLLGIHARTGLVVFHGPNLDQVDSRESFERLRSCVMETKVPGEITVDQGLLEESWARQAYAPVAGTADGVLVGGNLTALVSLWGTEFQPPLAGRLLFLEDRNERNDILDRWFTTLYASGALGTVAGVVFGQFPGCGPRGSSNVLSLEDLFGDRLAELGKPCCFGLPFGQAGRSATLPVGVAVDADMDDGVLRFVEPAVV